jgi:hypothetical protein
MHRRRLFLLIIGLFGLTLIGFASYFLRPHPPPPNLNSLHYVVATKGELSVMREGWGAYSPARLGTILRSGDLLNLENGGQATVVCADLSVVHIPTGVSGQPCTFERSILVYRESPINTPRDLPVGEFPIVVSPRRTKLLTTHPTLRWLPVQGVITYEVSIREWSTTVSSKTELVYPSDAPSLQAGQVYKLKVSVGDRTSEEELMPNLGFTILNADEARAIQDWEERINAMRLDDAGSRFLVASLYASVGLEAEAIEQLEQFDALINISPESVAPSVPRYLGDLYARAGLNSLAAERYDRAIQLSSQEGDIEGEALAHRALGQIYEASGYKQGAAQHLKQALELYQQLQASQTVEELQTPLAKLPEP